METLLKQKFGFGSARADAPLAKDSKALYTPLLDDDGDAGAATARNGRRVSVPAAAAPPPPSAASARPVDEPAPRLRQHHIAMGVGAGGSSRRPEREGEDRKDHKTGPSSIPEAVPAGSAAAVVPMDSAQARDEFARKMKGKGIDWSTPQADRTAKDARTSELQALARQMTPAQREELLMKVWEPPSLFVNGIDREGRGAAFDALCAGLDPKRMRSLWSKVSWRYIDRDARHSVRMCWLDALRAIAKVGFAGEGAAAEKALRVLAPTGYCYMEDPTHVGLLATALAPLMPRDRLKAYAGEIIDTAASLDPHRCSLFLERRALVLLAVWDALSPGQDLISQQMQADAMDGFEATMGIKMYMSLQARLHRAMVCGTLPFISSRETAEHLSHHMQAQTLHGLGPLERERALALRTVLCKGLVKRMTQQELGKRIADLEAAPTAGLSEDARTLRQMELDALKAALGPKSATDTSEGPVCSVS